MRKPRVTQLLDLLAKPALITWANEQGLKGINIKADRSKSLSAGTSMHSQIESLKFDDPETEQNHKRFMSDKELIDTEQDIETEWFVGRYDARIKWRGLTYLMDYKQSTRPRVYFEHKLQLAAYSMGVEADRFAIVATPAFIPVEVNIVRDMEKYRSILIALSKIYTLRAELDPS